MKKILAICISILYLFVGCQKAKNEVRETFVSIEFKDDVSPTRVILTPENVGIEQSWKLNGENFDNSSFSNTQSIEFIVEPDEEFYLQYETELDNILYSYGEWITAPPIANSLILYSVNFQNELPLNDNSDVMATYDYSFDFNTSTSSGSSGASDGANLVYNAEFLNLDFFSPIEIVFTPVFYDRSTPHVLDFAIREIGNFKNITCKSSENLQAIYFNQRFNYYDALIYNPKLIVFKDSISGLNYSLNVDWVFNEELNY